MGAATGDRFVWDNQWWIKHNLSLGYTMQVVAGLDEGVLQLPGYTLHDAQVQWRPMAMRNLTLSLAVRNIFDRLYREQTTIDYEEGGVRARPGYSAHG